MGNAFTNWRLRNSIAEGNGELTLWLLQNKTVDLFEEMEQCGVIKCTNHIQEKILVIHFLVCWLNEQQFQILITKQKDDIAKLVDSKTPLLLRTPLIFAVLHDNSATIEELIKFGCEVNVADKDGNTALHFAAQFGYKVCCDKLLEARLINCIFRNKNENNPLDVAIYYKQQEVAELLVTYIQKNFTQTDNKENADDDQPDDIHEDWK
jgi:hypothetical protein